MNLDEDYNRMRWASRRGLLELDLLLGPFMDACYRNLDAAKRSDYQRLMAHEDQDILTGFWRDSHWEMRRFPTSHRISGSTTNQS